MLLRRLLLVNVRPFNASANASAATAVVVVAVVVADVGVVGGVVVVFVFCELLAFYLNAN